MYILLRKHIWLLILYWTCFGHATDRFIYIYILTHVDALLWFYYVILFMMLWNANVYVMYYYIVCVFLDIVMHDVMVVCFLYAVVDVPI